MAASSSLSAVTRRESRGASGIGKRTAQVFAGHGAKVVIADIQDQLGQSVAQSIGLSDGLYVHCDVTNEAQVINTVNTAVKNFGKLDIMFNNSGISDPIKDRIIDNDKADFERVNITGVTYHIGKCYSLCPLL